MEKKEVIKAIEYEEPKEVPALYNWIADETLKKYGEELRSFLLNFPDDFILLGYGDALRRLNSEGYYVDEWGCRYEKAAVASRSKPALENWDDLNSYLSNFPCSRAPNRFGKNASYITGWVFGETFIKYPFQEVFQEEICKKNEGRYIIGIDFPLINELLMKIRGAEKLWLDLYLNKDKVIKLIEKLVDFHLGIVDGYADVGVDAIWFSDDWGTQNRLFINPTTWREVFKPWYKKVFEYVRKKGLRLFFHSCGQISPLIPDLVEIGVDVLHLGNPYTMNIEEIVKTYRGKVCFFGGIDIQELTKLSPEEVTRKVKRVFEIFSNPEGGFIIGPTNSITPDVPLENIKAMCLAIKKMKKMH
jgi:hypothetical protein